MVAIQDIEGEEVTTWNISYKARYLVSAMYKK